MNILPSQILFRCMPYYSTMHNNFIVLIISISALYYCCGSIKYTTKTPGTVAADISKLGADGQVPAYPVDAVARQTISRAPHAGKVGFSICRAGRRSIEVWFTVRCSRHAARRVVDPLRS